MKINLKSKWTFVGVGLVILAILFGGESNSEPERVQEYERVAPTIRIIPTAIPMQEYVAPEPTRRIAPVPTVKHVVPVQKNNACDPSYPDVCIAPYPPDLDCKQISYRRFTVIGSDPHGFDSDGDGIGCER